MHIAQCTYYIHLEETNAGKRIGIENPDPRMSSRANIWDFGLSIGANKLKDKCVFMLYNDVLPCIAIHFIFHAQQKKAREKRKKRSYTN